ncbi:MAG: protoporphyrinogen oxidase HemJ [Bosea sp. (in: a-proteobacteria)]
MSRSARADQETSFGMTLAIVKVVHILAVISWMAGLLYLPRLFVYHCSAAKGSELSETFKVMEYRLLRFIMTPAMVLSWIAGLWLSVAAFGFSGGWLHAKLLLVLLLSAAHGYMAVTVRTFAADANQRSHKFYRLLNEVPTVLMIGIVALVVLKPF